MKLEFKLQDLPFKQDAFAPKLSQESFSYHYNKHHKSYVDNLNKLCQEELITKYNLSNLNNMDAVLIEVIKKSYDFSNKFILNSSVDNILDRFSDYQNSKDVLRLDYNLILDKKIFNNAAQIWNHTFFWNSINPIEQEIPSNLAKMIENQWGSVEGFKKHFYDAGVQLFGSGWIWLVFNKNTNKLEILATVNAETPLLNSAFVPLLVVDAWEHAYYIDYRNKRIDYLDQIIPHLNWQFASKNFEEIA